jgi:hypothetical protein
VRSESASRRSLPGYWPNTASASTPLPNFSSPPPTTPTASPTTPPSPPYAAPAPVDASSGKTHRHRLNRGGDRSANTALWIIAPVRLMHDPGTRAYAARRTTLGDSRKDILRRLQRYISRELYPIITASLAPTTTANP